MSRGVFYSAQRGPEIDCKAKSSSLLSLLFRLLHFVVFSWIISPLIQGRLPLMFSRFICILSFPCIFFICITKALQNNTCYFPDGSVAVDEEIDYVQCKETSAGGFTHCCTPYNICTVGGYCVGNAGFFYRGGCTDKTWTSNLCPALCAKSSTSIPLIAEEIANRCILSLHR